MRVTFRGEAAGSVGEAQRLCRDLAAAVRASAGLPAACEEIPNLPGCNTAQARGERVCGAPGSLVTNKS